MINRDFVLPKDRIHPPSKLVVWIEERYLQRKLISARHGMAAAEALVVYAKNDVARSRAHLFEVQDTMRMRGFRTDFVSSRYPADLWMLLASGLIGLFTLGVLAWTWPVVVALLKG